MIVGKLRKADNKVTEKNRAGRLVKLTDSSGTVEYEYGKLGETVKESRELNKKTGAGKTKWVTLECQSPINDVWRLKACGLNVLGLSFTNGGVKLINESEGAA